MEPCQNQRYNVRKKQLTIPLNFFLAFFPPSILDPIWHHCAILSYVVFKHLNNKQVSRDDTPIKLFEYIKCKSVRGNKTGGRKFDSM